LIQQAREPIETVVGAEGIMTSYGAFPYNGEDFAYFLEKIPGAMFFLGVTNEEKGIRGINHLPDYDVDEESILIGTKSMSGVLLNYLMNPSP
jgi:metal-dependent amidase/aminoacylase/carboxypeptidase family protein